MGQLLHNHIPHTRWDFFVLLDANFPENGEALGVWQRPRRLEEPTPRGEILHRGHVSQLMILRRLPIEGLGRHCGQLAEKEFIYGIFEVKSVRVKAGVAFGEG